MNAIKIFIIVLIAILPVSAEQVSTKYILKPATDFMIYEISEQGDSCIQNLEQANINLQKVINSLRTK